MATDDSIRASDSDRDAVVTTLREAYMAGRITLDEFNERMAAAYVGRTWGDLRALTADLPARPALGGDVPGHLRPRPPLPQHPLVPGPSGPPPARQRNPIAILIPIAVWTLIALNAGAAHGVAVLVTVMLVVAFLVAAIRRG